MKLSQWLVALPLVGAALHTHDSSFTPDYVLRVTAKDVNIGGISRYSTLFNGSTPGPPLRLPHGKVVWVRVYNDMPDQNLTTHWHGLAQAAYPFSDGTPQASQWPIPPQHFFDYELQTPKSGGTYFYHSHVGFQAVSASGPLIIEDGRSPPHKYDDERTVHIQELFNKTDATIIGGLQNITKFTWSGEPNGFMINGDTISNFEPTDKSSQKLNVITVDPGKTYRFRWIGAQALSLTSMAIDGHKLQVIEADGAYTKPQGTDFLQVGPGQRYSTLVQTLSCRELRKSGQRDYYLQIENRERPANVTNYAIVRYSRCAEKTVPTDANPTKAPLTLPPTDNGFLDYKLAPLKPNNFPTASEVTRRVTINVQQIANTFIYWQDNNVSWVEGEDPVPHTSANVPYLVALYENEKQYLPSYSAAIQNGGVYPATKAFPGKIGEVLEIVLQNLGSHTYDGTKAGGLDVHPWHAHGEHYYDIGGGPGAYDAATAEANLKGTTPVQRDTTMLYRYNATTQPDEKQGWRAWRLRVQQPGVWMIHCHTLQHMVMGMQTVWVFGGPKDIKKVGYPDVAGYLTYGGNVNGNASYAPHVYHFSDDDDN